MVLATVLGQPCDGEVSGCAWKNWLQKHALADQVLSPEAYRARSSLTQQQRQLLGVAIPFLLVHIVWWSLMFKNDSFDMMTAAVGPEGVPAYFMSITMVFGSMVAGATSEGGAAIAFPVMTLAFGIHPAVARDFSYMIQSVGMTGASFAILFIGLQVERKTIIYGTAGGVCGVILGLEQIVPLVSPPYAKMYFTVVWASFAVCLFYVNCSQRCDLLLVLDPCDNPQAWRSADLVPPEWSLAATLLNWKAIILVAAGFVGGICTSISGSGIDICSFAVLTLFFSLSEKIATPTSVILMAINTFVAMCYRNFWMNGLEPDAWNFFVVCAPIVVVGAPLGALLSSFLHRQVLAGFIYVVDTVQLLGALYVVRPWTHAKCNKASRCDPPHLVATSIALFVCGVATFYGLRHCGKRIAARRENVARQKESPLGGQDAPEEACSRACTALPAP